MLLPRIIPILLVSNNGLVKTQKFREPKYVGDPINAVRIFNEKEVDELTLLDIDASRLGRVPNYDLIEALAAECRMPFCYGGGVTSADQAQRILSLGVEKVSISSAALERPTLIAEIAQKIGAQSVVVTLDVRASATGDYEVYVLNGSRAIKDNLVNIVERFVELGAGEIVLNSIDRDGTLSGYDLNLVRLVKSHVDIPVTLVGGAGSLEDIRALVEQEGTIGAGAGSLFVFKGKFRAVLINYPSADEKKRLMTNMG